MKKRAWHFLTKSGKGGSMILDYIATADEALKECVLSLGEQVIQVY